MRLVLSTVAACLALGGCASPDTMTSTEPHTDREYRTGSNIPQRARPGDGVGTLSAEDLERMKNATTATIIRKPAGQ
jgi:uncharacterized protein YceK